MGSNGKVFNALVYPFVTSMNKDDMSSLKDKVGALIHESREDMINYHKGLYDS